MFSKVCPAHLSWISSIFLRSAIGQKSMEKRMMYVSSVVMISSPICNKHEMKKRVVDLTFWSFCQSSVVLS